MKRHTMAHMQEGGVNVTPLIDIVMVLIVFFMLVAKIGVTRGEDSDIPLPSVILGKKLESLSNTFTLNVHWNHNGEEPGLDALVEGSKRDLHVTKQYSGGRSDTELFRVLDAFHKSHPDMNLIIRADQDMPYRQLELVLLAAAGAEIGNISYEARQTEAVVQQ